MENRRVNVVGGIDGGQSSTVAVVMDEAGQVLGRGTAGPSDHVGQPADSSRAARACERALNAARHAAGLDPAQPLAAVTIGMSGYDDAWHGEEPALGTPRWRCVHDAPAALAGALTERPAGVVIAGTGSAGYGERATGEAVRAGGYGYLFGDAGSAFAIARSALAEAMVAADDGRATDLGAAALAFFDVRDLRAFVRAVSLGSIARPHIAGFARVVLDAARLGDATARRIIETAATDLAGLASTIAGRLRTSAGDPIPIALVGGIGEHPSIAAAVAERLAGSAIALVAPAHEPAVGAALLAFDLAELPRPVPHAVSA